MASPPTPAHGVALDEWACTLARAATSLAAKERYAATLLADDALLLRQFAACFDDAEVSEPGAEKALELDLVAAMASPRRRHGHERVHASRESSFATPSIPRGTLMMWKLFAN